MDASPVEPLNPPAHASPWLPAENRPGARGAPAPLLTDQTMALAQGVIYVVSGVWPIVHLPSFETVTGPKVDGWLVKTVGAMIATVGVVLLSAAKRNRVTPEIAALGAGCAATLAAIDVVYVTKGRISPIYLADAVMEAGIIAGWGIARNHRSRSASR